ncbi:hypothetical protein HBF24_03365 [Oleiagrimonas sp. C23AA]|nr:hypothetical protein [Oleiagrimonas sp. C23AA]
MRVIKLNSIAVLSALCVTGISPAFAQPNIHTNEMELSNLHAPSHCMAGLETILPGAYYSCEAKRDLKQGHTRRAVSRLREAAYWGDKPAQYLLGVANYNGELGLPADKAKGLVWLGLAAERDQHPYMEHFAAARARASASEVASANALWKQMYHRYGDKYAARRAQRKYEQYIEQVRNAEASGGTAIVRGASPPSIMGDAGLGGANSLAMNVGGASGAFSIDQLIRRQARTEFSGLEPHVTIGTITQIFGDLSKDRNTEAAK